MKQKIKVLNLYAGIGGNRKLWKNVDVTAIEYDEETANVYRHYFPKDKVIVTDAHQYLLEHFAEFDFIWSSPPCPSHSRINISGVRIKEYPDMKLYEEIIFLKQWFKGKWVVENVIPYYTPLIQGKIIDRHLFWSNFKIGLFEPKNRARISMKNKKSDENKMFEKIFGYDLSSFKLKDKNKNLRNCVHPETGLYVFNCANNNYKNFVTKQETLF